MFASRKGVRPILVLVLVVLMIAALTIPAGADQLVAAAPTAPAPGTPAPDAATTTTSTTPEATPAAATEAPAAVDGPTIDTARADQGVVTVNYVPQGKRLKVTVAKGSRSYAYNYNQSASFPLQMGEGTYTVRLLENTSGNGYRMVASETFVANIADTNAVYLQSIQLADWRADQAATLKAQALTKGLTTDLEKVKAIHSYVVNNFDFDRAKLGKLTSDYIPSVDRFYAEKSGICYDFTSLLAAMLRSAGVPTKVVKGYGTHVQGYHAWNEVLIDGTWRIIDSSTDAQLHDAGLKVDMFKDANDYRVVNEY